MKGEGVNAEERFTETFSPAESSLAEGSKLKSYRGMQNYQSVTRSRIEEVGPDTFDRAQRRQTVQGGESRAGPRPGLGGLRSLEKKQALARRIQSTEGARKSFVEALGWGT